MQVDRPGGKQIFTVSLIHAGECLIDVVHRRAIFLGRNMAVLMPYLPTSYFCAIQVHNLRSKYALSERRRFLLLYVLSKYWLRGYIIRG